MKATIKQVFESDNWILTKVAVSRIENLVRVDAKRRFHVADQPRFFSEWCSYKYANKLSNDNYGKRLEDLNSFSLRL